MVCGLSCVTAMRHEVWAEIFKVFQGIYLLFLTAFMRMNSSSAFKTSTLLSLLRAMSKVLRSSFWFIWGHCFGCEMLPLATWIFFLNNHIIRLNILWPLKKVPAQISWLQSKKRTVYSAGMFVLLGTLLGIVSPNSGE